MTFTESFVPIERRGDQDIVAKTKILVGSIIFMLILTSITTPSAVVIFNELRIISIGVVYALYCLLTLAIFWRTRSLRVTTVLLLLGFSGILLYAGWIRGGTFASMPFLILLPFFASMVSGGRMAFLSVFFGLVALAALYILRLDVGNAAFTRETITIVFTLVLGIVTAGYLGQFASRTHKRVLQQVIDTNQTLVDLKKNNDATNWIKSGQMGLLENMRGEKEPISLCKKVITFLAKFLEMQVGTLYLADANGVLELAASYAYNRRKQVNNKLKPGDGLVGQAALEKESILISEVPEDYICISSSLGKAVPRNILVTPVVFDGDVIAVLELGSLRTIGEKQIGFLHSIGENLAIAIKGSHDRTKIQELLDETQQQTQGLQKKQLQLQQSNQQLEEQSENLRQSEQSLKEQSEELQAANEELEEKTEYLEIQKADIAGQNRDLVLAQKEIEAKARELEYASKYKSEFLANMSHELRTPLNSLLILAKTLADNKEGNLTEEQKKSAQIIHGGGNDLLSLINDILDLSKVEAGMLEVNMQQVEVDTLIFGLQEAFEPIAEQKGLEFAIEKTPDLPAFIETDSHRAQQVLKNLLSNALKFTNEGSVTLRIHLPQDDVRFSNPELFHDKALVFSVIDTGIGIPEDRQRAVFEAFQQAEGGTSRKYGGTGLGLSISQELTRLLGGEIQLESSPGEGSVFALYLPYATLPSATWQEASAAVIPMKAPGPKVSPLFNTHSKQAQESNATTPKSQPFVADDRGRIAKGDKTILVVEDDVNLAKILVDLSRKRGYKCVATPDGTSALRVCAEIKPTAVLLDLGLPDIVGLNVLEQLEYDPDTRHIPVHIISGREDAYAALQDGAIGFLKKPASAEAVNEAFSKLEAVASQKIHKVLVVEQNNGEGDSIAEILQNSTIDITTAESGTQAIEMYKAHQVHCVVVDDPLSDMTILELIDKIGVISNGEPPPTIVHSQKAGHEPGQIELHRRNDSAVIKQARSLEHVLDEATLFLHSVESSLSPEQQQVIRMLHSPERLLQGRKVMLVDDDMRNTFALSKVLRDQGLKVVMADNGQVALEKLELEDGVELVIMDIMMPVMDGYEAISKIRSHERFSSLPIVALTAKSMTEDRAKCLKAGANDYMTKPVDVEKLLSILRVWLFEAA